MAHYIPTTFDYTRVEIWVPLIVGARIAILPYADAFDGRTLESTLRKSRAFSTLRMVLFGGDAANPKAVARLLESGGAPKDTHSEPVSIGRPTGDTVVHILDDALQPVPGGEVGEVFLGGPGVSRGYMNAQAKNTTSFINIKSPPGLDETTRVYRTGDLVRHDPSSGQIYYLGRQDHQVTIFTMRIELAAVKATLMKTGRFVDAVALAIHSLIKEMGKLLVSYIIPAEDVANDKVWMDLRAP
ncbi:hypothetical protein BDV27DRAFT_157987 [Aspergillus caelatus]|uniref:AMP-dependent synthetase/ligase domain-containing protein n=1 Tax=Aspergillus caelatus TaxID=61420 RepID=A0A5N7A314_9EURO|nr:uncharacterized protein BDV27DRAFT_157987 [Aspergillus caelatus]KAE8364257.1 hypothetical protein BDV27DRAFT_157987 [Aspergillus caelatus]